PEAAVNAVFYNKLMQVPKEERPALVQKLREEYRDDIDIYKLASELIVDGMVEPGNLRKELIFRFRHYESKDEKPPERKHGILPM
ncbi:unnamed protein product, partial [marine sediment metagenome]